MSITDDKMISVLLDCLHQDPDRVSADRLTSLSPDEWQTLLGLARTQNVAALLYQRLKARGLSSVAPAEALLRLRDAYRANAEANLALYGELNRVARAFAAEGIPLIVLKGAFLGEVVYGDPALRDLGDLDLMAPQPDLSRAVRALKAQGYAPIRPITDAGASAHLHLPRFAKPDSADVELHWTVTLPNQHYSIGPEGLWQRATPALIAGVEVLGLCPEDLLLHLCAHTSYQHLFEFGLRPSCDIAQVIDRYGEELAWEEVVARAGHWHWGHGAYLALRLAKELVGAAVPDGVLRALWTDSFDEALVATARTQVFTNRHTAYALSANLVQLWQGKGMLGRIREFWRGFLLPRGQISAMYGVPGDSPRLYL